MEPTTISIDDFNKITMSVGKVEQAEDVEKSTKLIRLHVVLESWENGLFLLVYGNLGTPLNFSKRNSSSLCLI